MKNRLKELRNKKHLTLKELGEQLGMPNNTLSQYETGKREPKLETWQKLADFFGVSVPYLQGISDIEDLEPVSTFEKFFASLEKTPDGKSVKVPVNEMLALSNGLELKTFLKINNAIISKQNGELSENDFKKYSKIVSHLDKNDFPSIGDINFYMTNFYEIMLDEINKDKKAKIALDEIKKIISSYLGLDYYDFDDEPITIKKVHSDKEK
ncbi:helix-turn-helix domain-containing protein [Lactobacillus taiwanensis]|uniref:helix-turn-helix domain-containing protein n=1 Tax=Lactobacillus taiwanensis TaxID=508451 RepID=UPI00272AAC56|nr:helix-turn-helix transcriptional regulator [Lactobacillus taiwanensis]MRM97787.1 XRE family transcriptional regulator [Lactobacillus taiwanensis]